MFDSIGTAHAVDSNDLAFSMAAIGAIRQGPTQSPCHAQYNIPTGFQKANPLVLQPIMNVEIIVPDEYQGAVIGGINKRRGTIVDSETSESTATIRCDVPLNDMFGYSSELRASTQGKGEFSMEFSRYEQVLPNQQQELMKAYAEARKN